MRREGEKTGECLRCQSTVKTDTDKETGGSTENRDKGACKNVTGGCNGVVVRVHFRS